MNRRNFISKGLAGIAGAVAFPHIGLMGTACKRAEEKKKKRLEQIPGFLKRIEEEEEEEIRKLVGEEELLKDVAKTDEGLSTPFQGQKSFKFASPDVSAIFPIESEEEEEEEEEETVEILRKKKPEPTKEEEREVDEYLNPEVFPNVTNPEE